MSYSQRPRTREPGTSAIYDAVRFITVFGTLLILAALALFLVTRAGRGGFYPGIRSFASVLLPIIIGSFVFVFSRETIERLRALRTAWAFSVSTLFGVAIMVTLQFLSQLSEVPIAELLVSACFSLLVFASGSPAAVALSGSAELANRSLSYYYGVVSGMLLYVVLLGFPVMGGGAP